MVYIILILIICLVVGILIFYKMKSTNLYDTCAIFETHINNDISIVELLKLVAENHPNITAIKIKNNGVWKNVSYAEYYKKVKNFAQSTNYWLGSGVNGAIMGANSSGSYYAHLGLMLNGGYSVCIEPHASSSVFRSIIKNENVDVLIVENDKQLEKIEKFMDTDLSGVRLIIYYAPISESMISKFKIPVISMGNFMTEINKLDKKVKYDDIATITYDKHIGHAISHKNIMTSLKNMISTLKTKSSIKTLGHEQFISYKPLNTMATQIMDIYLSIACVGCVWFADRNANTTSMVDNLNEIKPTIFVGTLNAWSQIKDAKMNNKNIGLDKSRLNISLLSYIFPDDLALTMEIYKAWTQDEACGFVTLSAPNMSKKDSIGIPLMNVKFSKDNEILIKGDNLFVEYHNYAIQPVIKDGWFKTGQKGRLDRNGYVFIM